MNAEELSKEMVRALEHARKNGGKLSRRPGGFWISGDSGISFGTTTINALVLRKKAIYSDWKKGANGDFPIEMTLAPAEEHGPE